MPGSDPATGLVMQFGTSRFLQAHADLFLHEAREAGQAVPPIVVVQTTGAAEREARLAGLSAPAGFPVIVRGLEGGNPIERRISCKSVTRGLSAGRDWATVTELFLQARFVISNTADAGYAVAAGEGAEGLEGKAPLASFPGKLAQLLYARWHAGGAPLTCLPCELVSRNGQVLKKLVRGIAVAAGAPADFLSWLDAQVLFANTLVDRIVSEPIEPAGAVAEPYALWAIEKAPGLALPCEHPSIVLVDDLEPYERLKLHILNLGHTFLAEAWRNEGRAEQETVKSMLADPGVRAQLDRLYENEVVPGFAARGMELEARGYVQTTMDRFLNPYLNHRVADIAGDHALKVRRRIAGFIEWAGTSAPILESIVARHGVAA
ncbi:MAG: mannitol dehydrogenase family protein [Mesorhizobium sp.]|nr:MAG: mannitol dehydrogenase family protein [Mesorhizobium sp.]